MGGPRLSAAGRQSRLGRFAGCESGGTAIEYTLVCAFMAVALIAALELLHDPLITLLTDVAGMMQVPG
ncbi:Flp family type IVb pilin [Jiella endophytica]|uniref:Flp family type IVb pilin n=1 Tax=Jiella endophytica TaxID=2558362 RepID=A0A4Y8RBI5_9HYPH|nr:Flp family type IVb pilin [Jiella endophytica]TFF18239.1 Flp family type IVb pilin [Jiella endophytica]